MFDHEHRVAQVDQALEHFQERTHIVEMKAGGRFVEDVEGLACLAFLQFARKFYALRFTARKRGCRLTELDITKPHIMERLELAPKRGDLAEEFEGFIHGHLEHFVDVLALVGHLQRFAIVARTIAHFTIHVHIGEEVHLDLLLAVALARFAASTCNIEGETAWSVAARLALLRGSEEIADVVPEANVGCRVGTRGATDRALIDADHLVDELYPFELLELAHLAMRAIHAIGERWGERVGNERALARARNTVTTVSVPDRDLCRNILEVVLARHP